MNPQRLQTRTDLIEYILEHAPLSGVRRAIDEGRVRVCGGFASCHPHISPGFVVEVTSKHGRTWPVAVLVDQIKHRYRVVVLDEVPWQKWDGKYGRGNPVYDGDNPAEFYKLRKKARRNKWHPPHTST